MKKEAFLASISGPLKSKYTIQICSFGLLGDGGLLEVERQDYKSVLCEPFVAQYFQIW